MILKIAKKEVSDILKDKLFLITLIMLLVLTVISVVLGAYQVRANVNNYNASIDFLKSIGKVDLPSPPKLNPIAASKGFVNYIGMIGALIAIVIGNFSIMKEHRAGTLRLILSRGVYRDQLLNGKILGNLLIIAGITILTELITFVALFTISGTVIQSSDTIRLILFFMMSFLYMSFFMLLSLGLSLLVTKGHKALLLTIIIWLTIAFVFPQIGDTMDMDNQLPGGFFSSMGMTRDQEQQVLSKFKVYETLRDGIEELSPTKHYERMSYALLNIKPGFDTNTPLGVVAIKWIDLLGLLLPSLAMTLASYGFFLKRENIYSEV